MALLTYLLSWLVVPVHLEHDLAPSLQERLPTDERFRGNVMVEEVGPRDEGLGASLR